MFGLLMSALILFNKVMNNVTMFMSFINVHVNVSIVLLYTIVIKNKVAFDLHSFTLFANVMYGFYLRFSDVKC